MQVWKTEGLKWRNTAGFLGGDKLGAVSIVLLFFPTQFSRLGAGAELSACWVCSEWGFARKVQWRRSWPGNIGLPGCIRRGRHEI